MNMQELVPIGFFSGVVMRDTFVFPGSCERIRLVQQFEDIAGEDLAGCAHIVVQDFNVDDDNIKWEINYLKESDEPQIAKMIVTGFLEKLLEIPHDDNCEFCENYGT